MKQGLPAEVNLWLPCEQWKSINLNPKENPETALSQYQGFSAIQNKISKVIANLALLTAAILNIANLS